MREVAFVHAILANAAAATGDPKLHARHYSIAAKAGAALPGEERAIFDKTLRVIPKPADAVSA